MDGTSQQLVEEVAVVQVQCWRALLELLPKQGDKLLYLYEVTLLERWMLEGLLPRWPGLREGSVRRDLRENLQIMRTLIKEVTAARAV